MKKLTFTLGLATAVLLGACGSEEASSTTEEKTNESEAENTEEVAETTEPMEDYSLSIPDKEDMEIVNEVTYAFIDTSSDTPWASYYAEIKNNSEVPVDLSSSSVVYSDEKGESVIMVSDMGLEVHPQVVKPGETAFVNIYDPIQDTEAFSNTYQANIELQPMESIDQVVMHEVENVNVIYKENGDFSNIRATGTIETTAEVVGYDLAVMMYDADGKFLGTLTGGSDEDLLKSGDKTSFEIENPPFPQELMPEVAEWKAIAYTFQ